MYPKRIIWIPEFLRKLYKAFYGRVLEARLGRKKFFFQVTDLKNDQGRYDICKDTAASSEEDEELAKPSEDFDHFDEKLAASEEEFASPGDAVSDDLAQIVNNEPTAHDSVKEASNTPESSHQSQGLFFSR